MTEPTAPDGLGELADLFAEPVRLEVAGKSLEISPLTIRQTGQVATALKKIVRTTEGADVGRDLDIATLVVDHTEDMIRIVSIATREPEGWVAGLRSDDFTELATVVFRVNASFFLQRVMPKLAEIAPALNLILALGAGLESSPTSESEVTQAPKT